MALTTPLKQYSATLHIVETVTTVLAVAAAVVVAVVVPVTARIVKHHIVASIVVTWVTLRDTDGCVVTRM